MIISSRLFVGNSISVVSLRQKSTAAISSSRNNGTKLDNLVSGVTSEMIQNDPVIADYVRSNFPEYFVDTTATTTKKTKITNWGERRRNRPQPALNIRSMATVKRDPDHEEGSNRCFSMRRQGFIPGVIYGGDPTMGINGQDLSKRFFVKTPSNIIQSELDRHRYAFGSRVFDLTVYDTYEQLQAATSSEESENGSGAEPPSDGYGGVVHRVMPRDIQQHPVNDTVYCCNFLRYFPGRPIKIPLLLINEEESPALKRDGFLIPINRFVECVVDEGVEIPDELEVECTGLQFNQVIRLDRVLFPDGVRPSKKVLKHPDFMIGPIHGGKGEIDDEATQGGGEGEA